MAATAFGAQMPPEITLDDVAAADEHHRYELSREGVRPYPPAMTIVKGDLPTG